MQTGRCTGSRKFPFAFWFRFFFCSLFWGGENTARLISVEDKLVRVAKILVVYSPIMNRQTLLIYQLEVVYLYGCLCSLLLFVFRVLCL
ncbi:hypothetical protein M758_1G134300 [Ceratodon purpureus]|nr:hypothetical protein M758_1G134300 [Ceratodon purpureus]